MEIVLIIIIRRTQALSGKCWETVSSRLGAALVSSLHLPPLPVREGFSFKALCCYVFWSCRFWLIFSDGKWSRKHPPSPPHPTTLFGGISGYPYELRPHRQKCSYALGREESLCLSTTTAPTPWPLSLQPVLPRMPHLLHWKTAWRSRGKPVQSFCTKNNARLDPSI